MTDRGSRADHQLETRTIHAAAEVDAATGAVAPPLYQTSTFAFTDCAQGAHRFDGTEDGYIYTRLGNPTTDRLERAIAELERGVGSITTSSGMAALCTTLFGVLGQGDHMVGTSSVYGPSRAVVERHFSRFGVASTFVDTSDLEAVRAAIRPDTKLVFIETPANPTVVLTDIAAVARIAHEHGALLLVDNTFASPILQRPVEYGADLVMHSITKFLNGHTDVVGGVIIARDPELLATLRSTPIRHGWCCAGCAPCRCVCGPRRTTRGGWRSGSSTTTPSNGSGIPVSPAIHSTPSPRGRWTVPGR